LLLVAVVADLMPLEVVGAEVVISPARPHSALALVMLSRSEVVALLPQQAVHQIFTVSQPLVAVAVLDQLHRPREVLAAAVIMTKIYQAAVVPLDRVSLVAMVHI
jgi:hypothetical protein